MSHKQYTWFNILFLGDFKKKELNPVYFVFTMDNPLIFITIIRFVTLFFISK